jgi:hypothetical protein
VRKSKNEANRLEHGRASALDQGRGAQIRGGSCSRRVWAFAPSASCSCPLCSPVSHFHSFVLALQFDSPFTDHFTSPTRHSPFTPCYICSCATARWPIDPDQALSRPLPLCCCFRTRIRPTFATAAASRTLPALRTSNNHDTHTRCP